MPYTKITWIVFQSIKELKQRGFNKVLLWVLEENHRARKFYESNGFTCSEVYMEDNIGGKQEVCGWRENII